MMPTIAETATEDVFVYAQYFPQAQVARAC